MPYLVPALRLKVLSDGELLVRLQDHAAPDLIRLGVEANDKEELLARLVELLQHTGRIRDTSTLMRELLKREQVMSTGIGSGIAIPHALTEDIENLVIVFGRTSRPIDFQALDSQPVDLVFMLVGPRRGGSVYVKLLARVSRLLQNEQFKERLRQAREPQDVIDVFTAEGEYAS